MIFSTRDSPASLRSVAIRGFSPKRIKQKRIACKMGSYSGPNGQFKNTFRLKSASAGVLSIRDARSTDRAGGRESRALDCDDTERDTGERARSTVSYRLAGSPARAEWADSGTL